LRISEDENESLLAGVYQGSPLALRLSAWQSSFQVGFALGQVLLALKPMPS